MTREDIRESIKRAAASCGEPYLTYKRYKELTCVPMSAILRFFDTWRDACEFSDVTSGSNGPENISPNYSKGKEHALKELQKASANLGKISLSKTEFDKTNPEVRASTVARLFGSWSSALHEAGLERSENFCDAIDLPDLANQFMQTFREIDRVPTVHQLVRRSTYGKNTYTRKFGGYNEFKRHVIEHLLKFAKGLSPSEQAALQDHLEILPPRKSIQTNTDFDSPPHHQGRTLGFRAFVYAPTYEAQVTSIFATVADELGFEIVNERSAFPDCEARCIIDKQRKRFKKCLIEFELRSSDFRRHSHPIDGCDLIVCWEHDWLDCPLDVLELQREIRHLPGWK